VLPFSRSGSARLPAVDGPGGPVRGRAGTRVVSPREESSAATCTGLSERLEPMGTDLQVVAEEVVEAFLAAHDQRR